MGSFTLSILAYGKYGMDQPVLNIFNDGVMDSSHSVSSSGTEITLTLTSLLDIPSALGFTFGDGSLEPNRSIELREVKINGRFVDVANYLSSNSLAQNETANVDVNNGSFLFKEPEADLTIFSNPTVTLTDDRESFRDLDSSAEIVDAKAGNDYLYLGSGDDSLYGNDGDDRIFAGAGDDYIVGGEGDDHLYGHEGDDQMYGGNGDDTIRGNEGNDFVAAGNSNDIIIGHEGDDVLLGQDGNDSMSGNDGNDTMYGDAGNDTMMGHQGDDFIDGGIGNDNLYGQAGNDVIYGNAGSDNIRGGDGNDILHGNEGYDIIYGDAGDDILYGGADSANALIGGEGNDILISRANLTLDADINNILSSNAGITYNAETNSFYQYIATTDTWDNAMSHAASSTLTGLEGVSGTLVTITSETENDFVSSLTGGSNIWLGASDASVEGEWTWSGGDDDGRQFWEGSFLGDNVNGMYNNWGLLNPSLLSASGDDYAVMNIFGSWSADTATATNGYVIEWDASSLAHLPLVRTKMNGDTGSDSIYGNDGGMDSFIIRNVDAVDEIYNFNASERDQIDLSLLISGYDPVSDAISDFVTFTQSGEDTIISIDGDGAANGSNFTDVASIQDQTGFDVELLLSGDNLII